jgi:hypothetical protein
MTCLRLTIWRTKPTGPDACLYKQSQSHRLGDGPEGPDIPPFHYSIIPPFQSDAGRATSPRCPASGNKANFRQPGRRRPIRCAKQTQFSQGYERRQMLSTKGFMDNWTCERPRQNKANSCTDEVTAGGRGDYVKQSQFPPRARASPKPNRAKQSQFAPRQVWTKWRRASERGPGDAPKGGPPKPHTIASTVTLSTRSSGLARDGGPSGDAYAGLSLPFSRLDLSR